MWKKHLVFHTSLLRPFRTSTWTVPTDSATDELELEDTEPYDVERLLRWRWRGPSGKRYKEFLVLWAGYPIEDSLWIPDSNFDHPEELQNMINRDKPTEDT